MTESSNKKLCVILTDPLKVYYKKGEIKKRYYNPDNFFEEVFFISFCSVEIESEKVKEIVGNAKINIYPVGHLLSIGFPLVLYRIYKILNDQKPEIIRAYDTSFRGFLVVLLGKFVSIPSVVSLHIQPDDQRKFDKRLLLKFRKILEYLTLRNASWVICVTNYIANSYLKKYRKDKYSVIYNRVDLKQFEFEEKPRTISNNCYPTILSVGRLCSQKYQECLIYAIQDLPVKLLLIGDGDNKNTLVNLVKDLQLTYKIQFIKSVPNSKIHNYYHASHIFAIATHYEGFCIPVFEAMAASMPIIASDIPPIKEILGESGILVKNDPVLFAKTIIAILENQSLSLELGKKSRKRAEQISADFAEKKEHDLYQHILTG